MVISRAEPGRDPSRLQLVIAVDRQEIVDTLWYGLATVGSSPIVTGIWPHHPELEPWPYDPVASRRELESLGWRDDDGDGLLERDGEPFALVLLTNANSAVRCSP